MQQTTGYIYLDFTVFVFRDMTHSISALLQWACLLSQLGSFIPSLWCINQWQSLAFQVVWPSVLLPSRIRRNAQLTSMFELRQYIFVIYHCYSVVGVQINNMSCHENYVCYCWLFNIVTFEWKKKEIFTYRMNREMFLSHCLTQLPSWSKITAA